MGCHMHLQIRSIFHTNRFGRPERIILNHIQYLLSIPVLSIPDGHALRALVEVVVVVVVVVY